MTGKPDVLMTEADELMELHPYTYISGPMTGMPEWNIPAFAKMAKLLRAKGLKVVNPHESHKPDAEKPWDWYIRRDLVNICKKVGRVVVLPGWQNSRGASLEVYVAQKLGCEIIFVSDFEAWYAGLPDPVGASSST